VVTSGIYERVRMLDGRPCGHVFDPARGEPASALASVTVAHPDAALADAASTALLVAGPVAWQALAQRMGVDQVLVLDGQGRRQTTPAMARRLL
jgi:thiamine biosynthesis lipoprotein